MFDVGFWELALIGTVALLIVGPERLPGVARNVGLWVGKARRMLRDVKDDISRELREQEIADLDALKKDVAEVGSKISEAVDIKDTTESLRETLQQAAPSFAETPSPAQKSASKPASKKRAEKTTAKKTTRKKAGSKKILGKKSTQKKNHNQNAKSQTMSYYIYENSVHKYAKIHVGDCSHCNQGRGTHGVGGTRVRDEWHGPFDHLKDAEQHQKSLRVKDKGNCGHCCRRRPR